MNLSTRHYPQPAPGTPDYPALELGETTAPVIECSLPSLAWVAEDHAIAGSLTKPITAQTLLEEIHRVGQAQDILVIDDDRGFALLIDRILQTTGKPFEVRRAYDGLSGLYPVEMLSCLRAYCPQPQATILSPTPVTPTPNR